MAQLVTNGLDGSNGGFYTFHCHDLSADLAERFNLEINEYGLFTEIAKFEGGC
jgi:hypothetical protein